MAEFALLTIGDELIRGEITNKNAEIISKILRGFGHSLQKITVIGDDREEIASSLRGLCGRYERVIITGGLGPTGDDITREAVARACQRDLVYMEKAAEDISSYFEEMGREMTSNNLRQAYFPEGAEIIENNRGTAPGFMLELKGTAIYTLPGVTDEMAEMLKGILSKAGDGHADDIPEEHLLKVAGVGESTLEDRLSEIIDSSNFSYRFLPHGGEIEIRISDGAAAGSCDQELEEEVEKVRKELGCRVFACDRNIDLAGAVQEVARKKGITISLAESCTGGLICKRITDIPGSSQYFLGGAVAYSNDLKMSMLDVSEKTLLERGAVSIETAEEMASGVQKLTGSELAAAVTGIAGPGGGSDDKPVGLVYFALCHDDSIISREWHFNGDRSRVRWFTSQRALDFIRLSMLEEL